MLQTKVCPQCGTVASAQAKRCPSCGLKPQPDPPTLLTHLLLWMGCFAFVLVVVVTFSYLHGSPREKLAYAAQVSYSKSEDGAIVIRLKNVGEDLPPSYVSVAIQVGNGSYSKDYALNNGLPIPAGSYATATIEAAYSSISIDSLYFLRGNNEADRVLIRWAQVASF